MVFRVRSYLPEAVDRAGALVPDFARGHIPAIISSGERARDGFILEQHGLDFDRYRQNPVVLLNHDDGSGGSSALPIARSRDEQRDDTRDITTAIAEFDMDDELAVRVLGKIERGMINSTSIRWIPLEHRIDRVKRDGADETEPVIVFTRSEVLEWSFVPIPADTNAIVQRSDGTSAALTDLLAPERILTPEQFNPMSLVDVVDAAHALIEGRSEPVFTAVEQQAAARLYGMINGRVLQTRQLPSRATDEIATVLNDLVPLFRDAVGVLTKKD